MIVLTSFVEMRLPHLKSTLKIGLIYWPSKTYILFHLALTPQRHVAKSGLHLKTVSQMFLFREWYFRTALYP